MIKTTTIPIEEISSEQLDILPNVPVRNAFYNLPSGQEHYRLLRYIAPRFKLIYDIGSYKGYSALALSNAKEIRSFDIEDHLTVKLPKNCKTFIGSCVNNKLLEADFIFLDVDHSGEFETKIHEYLTEKSWKGILIADDIHFNNEMKKWWESIDNRKYDISHIGHHSGTGLIYYE